MGLGMLHVPVGIVDMHVCALQCLPVGGSRLISKSLLKIAPRAECASREASSGSCLMLSACAVYALWCMS